MSAERPDPSSDATPQRLAQLESTVAELARQVAALEGRLEQRAASPAAAPTATRATPPRVAQIAGDAWSALTRAPGTGAEQASHPDVTRSTRRDTRDTRDTRGSGDTRPSKKLDLESLVGRYGTMLLGGLTILLGVGAFLRWAIERVTIGPELRVGLGALGAAALGALGFWLRARSSAAQRRFGNVLLAIALAVVHVVAWGAGPALGVVPSGVALGIAALASVALAALAWRAVEQPLFVVGVGGALLAPFVTSAESGDPALLLLYGFVVLAAAIVALRDRSWPWAVRVCSTAALAYVGVALDASWSGGLAGGAAWLRRDGPALFVLACAWVALLWGGQHHRSSLARLFVLLLVLPIAARGTWIGNGFLRLDLLLLAAAGVVTLYLALRLRDARQPQRGLSALLQPLVLLFAALFAVPQPLGGWAAGVSLVAALLALLAAWDAGLGRALAGDATLDAGVGAVAAPPARALLGAALWHVHLLVAAFTSALALTLALRERPVLAASVLALHAAGTALAARHLRAPVLHVASLLVLAFATTWAFDLLQSRIAYEYLPFATLPSLAALVVVGAWYVVSRSAADMMTGPSTGPTERTIVRALGPALLLLWGREELSRAFSPDLAQFLLIAYFATAGVLLILAGRRRGVPGGRRVGLALAVYAALLALVQSAGFANVGLRVGSYLLVGGFLLAVAYWYRAAGEEEREEPGLGARGSGLGDVS